MTQATDIQVAEAVLAEIKAAPAGTFTMPFRAERIYLATPDIAKLRGVLLSVIPAELESALDTRTSATEEISINIGIRAKLSNPLPTLPEHVEPTEDELSAYDAAQAAVSSEMDALRYFTQQVRLYFEHPDHRRLAAMRSAVLIGTIQNAPIYVQEHLPKFQQYTSILTLTYKLARTL